MLESVAGLLNSALKSLKDIVEMTDFLGVAPWVLLTAVATWIGQAFIHKREVRKIELDHAAKVNESRDDLAIELLANARNEIIAARAEMTGLREEINSLRAMEQHFYHFQQALEHLAAVISSNTPEERVNAERNAKAFLNRMNRLQEAKGTIAQEAQIISAKLSETEKKVRTEGGQI